MRVLGVVPARGGSKGVPRKNIRPLAGKPLLQYTADVALAARGLDRVVLSTDDDEIATIGKRCGLDVPFRRPSELAQDDTPSLPVVLHALEWMEARGDHFEAVCLLQPTSPFRRPADIDACIELLNRSAADAVVTVRPVPHTYNPHWTYFRGPDGFLTLSTGEDAPIRRRQDLPAAFHRDGSIYVTRRDVLFQHHSLYGERLLGYVVDGAPWVDLDDGSQWARAEQLLLERAG